MFSSYEVNISQKNITPTETLVNSQTLSPVNQSIIYGLTTSHPPVKQDSQVAISHNIWDIYVDTRQCLKSISLIAHRQKQATNGSN